jgi:hypothetical protein
MSQVTSYRRFGGRISFPNAVNYLKADRQDLDLHQYHSEASNFSSLVSVNDVAANEMGHREVNQFERPTDSSLSVDIRDTKPHPSSSLRYCPSSYLIIDEASN